MGLISRDSILSVQDLQRETVAVPEWGGDVIISEMTAYDFASFHKFINDGENVDNDNFSAKLCVRCMVDDQGERMFSDADYPMLGKKNSKIVQNLARIAMKLNRLGSEVEDAKNSETSENGASTSV